MSKPSRHCEFFSRFPNGQCSEKAAVAYPAHGGQWMSLCAHHAAGHEKYTLSLEAIERGERHPWWDKYPADDVLRDRGGYPNVR